MNTNVSSRGPVLTHSVLFPNTLYTIYFINFRIISVSGFNTYKNFRGKKLSIRSSVLLLPADKTNPSHSCATNTCNNLANLFIQLSCSFRNCYLFQLLTQCIILQNREAEAQRKPMSFLTQWQKPADREKSQESLDTQIQSKA